MKKDKNQTKIIEKFISLMISVKNEGRKMTKEETLDLVAAVTTYMPVAQHFFYVFISSILTHWKDLLDKNFKLKKEEEDIASILINGFFEKGKWSRLIGFRGDCSLHSWMMMTSRQVLFSELKKTGEIVVRPSRNPSTTNLTLTKMEYPDERRYVVGLVKKPEHHKLLILLYVRMFSDQEAMQQMDIADADDYNKLKTEAEEELKARLIKTDTLFFQRMAKGKKKVVNLVPLALTDTSPYHRDVSFEDSIATIDNESAKAELDGAGSSGSTPPSPEEWNKLLVSAAEEINWWKSVDRRIFKERYFNKTPAAVVAAQVEYKSSYVDTTYDRTRKEFKKYVSNRVKNQEKNLSSAACILRYALKPQALSMPTDFMAFDNACVFMPEHEMEMCREIASFYWGDSIGDKQLLAGLKASKILEEVDTEKFHMLYGYRPKGLCKYVLSSTFVARMALTDHLRELRAFSGALYQDVANVEGILTVAIGLTFMKYLFHRCAQAEETDSEAET